MVEKTDRTAVSSGPRAADGRRFEVFVREAEADPLRHVGSVAAPTPDAAHEAASALVARDARDVWVCPAEETHRYSAEPLAAGETAGSETVARDGAPVDGERGSGSRAGPTGEGDR